MVLGRALTQTGLGDSFGMLAAGTLSRSLKASMRPEQASGCLVASDTRNKHCKQHTKILGINPICL